ncbi:synaptopodin [Tupaia chinensis]|uniref:synaptopodin n=1 Tax=Tupaia chinensis TaxID=246437 RepID=UPI0007046865|nr:synaptopodin [Tupaia chinensis]
MLGPHFPPPPLGPSEGRPATCAFRIPDGSYRCLALEAEESSSEEGLQGEAGFMDLEDDEVTSRSGDNSPCRATQGAAQLPRALGIQPPSSSQEARGGAQHDDRASQDWDVVKARQVMTTSPSPGPGPRAAQKPALGRSTSLTEKDLKEAKVRSQQIAAQLTTPPSSNSRGVQLFNRRRQRVNEFTLESCGRRGQKPSQEPLRAFPASPTGHAPGLSLSSTSLPEPGPQRHPNPPSSDRGVPGHSMEGYSEEASLLRHLEKMASEEEEVPLVVYLKENAALLTANGLHLSQNREAPQSPPTPPPSEVPSPAADINQNLPNATLTTQAPSSNHNPPATDVNQNPPATVTPQGSPFSSTQQNSPDAQVPANGTVPDSKPGPLGADRQAQTLAEEVKSSTLLIDKVSAPPSTPSTFSREATPIPSSGPPAPDFTSSSLLMDVQPSALPAPEQELSGRGATTPTTPTRVYSEVHLTLAKPPSVVNRTARPFGVQAPGGTSQIERSPMVERRHFGEKTAAPQPPSMADRSPRPQRHIMSHSPMVERRLVGQRSPGLERRPLGNFTPPPTYAETLSAAPMASRVRSPPSYSALYPSSDPKPHPKGQAAPASKTGILEESMARRGSRKSMFTFVEKPKVTPNPDLLDLVQTADEKRRQRDQGEAGVEEEPFALGAEASNFQQEPAPRDRASPAAAEEAVPEWASCLKSPRIQAKPKPKPNQNLSEASGKGAELYARRQSRMEKYVIESAGHPAELARCPSPTMSLPSSWKYSTSAPGGFRVASRSPARPPPASLYHGYLPENGVLRPEPTKSQLRPSLFVLSPIKEPAKTSPRAASPRAASPAKPSSLDLVPTLPRAGLPLSPALPRPSRSSPGLYSAPGQDGLQPTAVSPTYSSDISPVSPSRAWSPRAKQAPRPSFSTRNAGIEAQVWKPSFCFK